MNWGDVGQQALIIAGLCIFEIINGGDNAVVVGDIFAGIKNSKARLLFYIGGGFFALFVVRGILPFVIFAFANSGMPFSEVWHAALHADPAMKEAVERTAPILLIGAGVFLGMLSLKWLFTEQKDHFGFAPLERRCLAVGKTWFLAISSGGVLSIATLAYLTMEPVLSSKVMLSAFVSGFLFFVADGFKSSAEEAELAYKGEGSGKSDFSKAFFLIVIDLTFSIDSVTGAFAFTMVVLYILIGNGIGALVVMYLTVTNADRIKSFVYLKTGAMYSIGVLGLVMMCEGFGLHVPEYVSPLITFSFLGFFFWKSIQHNKKYGTGEPVA